MKRAIFAAVTAGLGALGTAGLMAAAPAQAACSDPSDPNPPPYTAPLTPARVACITNEQLSEFARTTSPAYNIDVLLNGTGVGPDNDGLGLNDQLGTFQSSVGDFLNGPRSPDPAPPSGSGL